MCLLASPARQWLERLSEVLTPTLEHRVLLEVCPLLTVALEFLGLEQDIIILHIDMSSLNFSRLVRWDTL